MTDKDIDKIAHALHDAFSAGAEAVKEKDEDKVKWTKRGVIVLSASVAVSIVLGLAYYQNTLAKQELQAEIRMIYSQSQEAMRLSNVYKGVEHTSNKTMIGMLQMSGKKDLADILHELRELRRAETERVLKQKHKDKVKF